MLDAIHQTTMIQQQRTRWHDKTIKHKQFQKGNWALLYDSRFENFQGKLRTRWLGPYELDIFFPNGIVRLLRIDDSRTPLLVNGYRLYLYQQPISKEDFKATYMADTHYVFLGESATPHCTYFLLYIFIRLDFITNNPCQGLPCYNSLFWIF